MTTRNKTVAAWGAGFWRSCLAQVVVTAIVLPLGLVLVILPLFIVQHWDLSDRATFLTLVIPLATFFLITFGGTMVFATWVLVTRRRRLDAAFVPLGLTPGGHLMTGRQYHGSLDGRRVDVYYKAGSGRGAFSSPPTLDVYIETPLATSFAFSTREMLSVALGGLVGRTPMALSGPEWSDRIAVAIDEDWTRALLESPAARDAVLRLTQDAGPFEVRQLFLRPEAFHLVAIRMPADLLTADNVSQWISDLKLLAREAESLAPPTITAEAGAMERAVRVNRSAFTGPVLVGCGLVTALLLGMLAVLLVLSFGAAR